MGVDQGRQEQPISRRGLFNGAVDRFRRVIEAARQPDAAAGTVDTVRRAVSRREALGTLAGGAVVMAAGRVLPGCGDSGPNVTQNFYGVQPGQPPQDGHPKEGAKPPEAAPETVEAYVANITITSPQKPFTLVYESGVPFVAEQTYQNPSTKESNFDGGTANLQVVLPESGKIRLAILVNDPVAETTVQVNQHQIGCATRDASEYKEGDGDMQTEYACKSPIAPGSVYLIVEIGPEDCEVQKVPVQYGKGAAKVKEEDLPENTYA